MPKILHNDFYDGGLNAARNNITKMAVLTGTPASATACEAATSLAIVSLVATDMIVQDGAVSGRRLTIAQKSTIAVQSTGVADTIALFSTGATGIVYAQTTCSTQLLSSTNNTVTVPAWSIELADPS